MMKRISAIMLAVICLLIAVGIILPVSAAGSYLRGDSDGDGDVTIMDATVIQRKLADLPNSSYDERAADIDGDGVNITDATKIQRYLAGFENVHQINEAVSAPDPDPTTPQPTQVTQPTQETQDTQATEPTQPTGDQYELPFVPKK